MKKQSGLLRRSIILALLLLCILAALTVVSFAADIVESGYCGGEGNMVNLSWTLDSEGILTISGTGIMRDYNYNFWWTDSKVKKVIIESGVTSIGARAFSYCSNLSSITIPASVTSIGDYAFSNCANLSSITIPTGVTSIGEGAFQGSGLVSITLPYGVASIEDGSFRGCGSLSSITISDSVTSIGYGVFESCKSLTNVKLSARLASIGGYAFSGCSGLTDITIPASVSSIGRGAFNGCSSISSIRVAVGNTVYDSRNNCNAIIETQTNTLILGCKNTVIQNTVESIGRFAFSEAGLVTITIPGNVKTIGEYAFYGCKGLTGVTISTGTTSIEQYAFLFCSSLASISLPDSITSIGNWAFENCSSLTSIVIPSSVTSIGKGAFSGCDSLSSVSVSALNSVYDSRSNCNAIIETQSNILVAGCQSTVIPTSVTSIGSSAFSGCIGLTSMEIPDSITRIESAAFADCDNLAFVSIPNSVTSIGESAFSRCYALTSVVIPASVTSIGDMAFSWCKLDDAFFCGNAPEMKYDVFNGVDRNTFTVHYISGTTGWTDSTAYNAARGTWNGYKLALWDGQFVQIQQADRQSITLQVQNHEEAYVYAAIYENSRFVKTVCKLVPVNAGEVTFALGLDELPEGAVVKAFVLAADGKTPLAKNAVWTVC